MQINSINHNTISCKSSGCRLVFNPTKKDLTKLRYIPEGFLKQEKTGSYEDFIEQFSKLYPQKSLKDFIKFIKSKSKVVGEGRKSQVFSIPKINDYLVKIEKSPILCPFRKIAPLEKVEDNFYGFNFGQAVADNNEGISILIKCDGEEYGIKNWADCINRRRTVTKEEVKKFINEDMARLSNLPQEAFDDFVKKISLIRNSTGCRPDFFNPNNFIIDYEKQKISIVDVNKDNEYYYSDFGNMIESLRDNRFLNLIDTDTREKYKKYEIIIKDKCINALQKYQYTFPRI